LCYDVRADHLLKGVKTKTTRYPITLLGVGGSFLLIIVFFAHPGRAATLVSRTQNVKSQYSCLPTDVKLSDPAVDPRTPGTRSTVQDKLHAVRARCRKARLLDRHGREIRFYHMVGCWGNPPRGYDEILKSQEREIANLRKRYTLFEIPCDTGRPIQ